MSAWPLVIVPVYNAIGPLGRCLESLSCNLPSYTEVLLINDASPDADIAPLLDKYAEQYSWQVQTNSHNLGFVKTANIGLRQAASHAVLLNSDTQVTPGWLQGMTLAVEKHSDVATVTPWTNNGEIASLPKFCESSNIPADPDAVAAVIAATGPACYPELPTAVGFCMLISANAMQTIDYFDELTFGLGYGEENDYSRRAISAGMRNILCDDVYVCHQGNQSFGPRGLAPGDESMQRLLGRHPDYLEVIHNYIAADPLENRRTKLLTAIATAGISLD